MPAIYEHRVCVIEDDIDGQGHVNNLVYLRWMQEAALAHSAEQGWPSARYKELGSGWVVRSHWIEYLQPTYLGDAVTILTWVSNFRKIRSLRKYKIVRQFDDRVLAVARTEWTFIGLQHGAPRRVPEQLLNDFELVPEDAEP